MVLLRLLVANKIAPAVTRPKSFLRDKRVQTRPPVSIMDELLGTLSFEIM